MAKVHPMLEKVAHALYRECRDVERADLTWEDYLHEAEVAVRTLMEPDEGMVEAGEVEAVRVSLTMLNREHSLMPENYPDYDGSDLAKLTFRAMLMPLVKGEGE